MVCRRDAGGEDQVGSPSLAGPSILEPARGRGAERVGSPAAPQPTPGCLHTPPGTMSPISRSLQDTARGERSGETDTLHLSSDSLSHQHPPGPCWGTWTPPLAREGARRATSLQLCSSPHATPLAKGSQGRSEAVPERSSLSRVAGDGLVNGACP